jgi:hypothetical protein
MYDLSNDIKILSVTNTRMTIGLPPDLASKFVTTPYATNTKSDFKKSNWLAMYKDILLSCSHPLDFWYFSRGVLDFLATRKTVPKLLKGVGRPFGKIKNGIAHLITDDFMAVLEVKTIRGVGDQLPSGFVKGNRCFKLLMSPVSCDNNSSYFLKLNRIVDDYYKGVVES